MVYTTAISGEINQLEKYISEFEHKLNYKPKVTSCGSDCYCRKAGNHKITTSLYHRDCIRMKKNTNAQSKPDARHPQNKISDRKEVYQLGKSQVEISFKGPSSRNIKCINDKQPRNEWEEKPRRLVDTGTDPITTLEPNRNLKKCWSAILSQNSKVNGPYETDSLKITSEVPEKLYTCSTHSSTHPNRRTVMVRDRGIQCHKNLDRAMSSPLNIGSSSSPVFALQSLMDDLKDFKLKLNEKSERSSLSLIISEMDSVLERLKLTSTTTLPLSSLRTDGFSHNAQSIKQLSTNTVAGSSLNNLQETCQELQDTCSKLEQTCQKLQKEKDQITGKFFEKSRDLESSLKRELSYQSKLNDAKLSAEAMAKKLDQYTKSMEELSIHVTRLQAENKALEQAEKIKSKLVNQLKEATKENEKLNNEIQLMTLEKEKNIVLLDIKEQELNKLKSELRSIGGLVSEKMLETVMAGDSMMVSSRLDITDSREIIFSSPDGTIKSPSKSWKEVSSIAPSNSKITQPFPLKEATRHLRNDRHDNSKANPLVTIHHLKNELRELFTQMKLQTEIPKEVSKAMPSESEISPWSTLTDSTDGYNSITEHDLSDVT